MRKPLDLTVTCLVVMLHSTHSSAAGWRIAFEDSFDGTALDRRKWATRYIYENGTLAKLTDEQQRYADNDNHRVANGVLSLVARPMRNRAVGGLYESGMIRSRQTFYYGYFEARVFLPNARGVWPALWLNSDYTGDGRLSWPPEIDAFEYVINGTRETPDMIHSAVMVGKTGAQGGSWIYRDRAFNEKWTYFRSPKPLNTAWQVIGLFWKPESVSMYLNGRKLYMRAYKWVYDGGEKAGPAHILLNLAIGGKWAGLNGVDDSRFPQELKVDYVRVCQYSSATGGSERCGDSPFAPVASEGAYSTNVDDLPRTALISAEVSTRSVNPGDTIIVKYGFNAVRSVKDHQIHTILVSDDGKDVAQVSTPPPVPTSRWRGSQVVTQSLTVPGNLPAGHYRLLAAVGPSSSLASGGYQSIPLSAHERFGVADGRLRYTVGEVSVKSKEP